MNNKTNKEKMKTDLKYSYLYEKEDLKANFNATDDVVKKDSKRNKIQSLKMNISQRMHTMY